MQVKPQESTAYSHENDSQKLLAHKHKIVRRPSGVTVEVN